MGGVGGFLGVVEVAFFVGVGGGGGGGCFGFVFGWFLTQEVEMKKETNHHIGKGGGGHFGGGEG